MKLYYVFHAAAIAAAAAVFLMLTSCGEGQSDRPAPAATKPEVGVVSLHPQSVAVTASLAGRTTAYLTAEVRPQVSGIIQQRLFQEGGEVSEGQALYQIDPASYQAAYDSALAALQKAEAAVPSAQTKVDRYQGLVRQNAISKQDLDDAVATLAQNKAAVAAAKADVETARINLAYTKIVAPISGRIDKSTLTPGALVTSNQETALTTIRTLDPINVDLTQSSTAFLKLRENLRTGKLKLSGANIKVQLQLDNGSLYGHEGELSFAESYVDETTGTFTLRAQFPNPERLLLPGMYVRAVVTEGVADDSFLVPQRAVTRNTKGEATALFVGADGKVQERVLSVRDSIGRNWLVDAGVNDGDRVIVEGSQRARAGQAATAVEVVIDETTGEIVERKQGALPAAELSAV